MSNLNSVISKVNNHHASYQEKTEALDELFLNLFDPSNQITIYQQTVETIKNDLKKIYEIKEELSKDQKLISFLEKLLLIIATLANNAEIRALLVRKSELVPIVTRFYFVHSTFIAEKVCSTLAPLVAGLSDAAEDAIKTGILPTAIDLVTAQDDNDKITGLRTISFLCSNEPTCATKVMFHGGIPSILGSLLHQNKLVQLTGLGCISKLVCSPTVRALISEILPQNKKEIKILVELCYSKTIDISLEAVHATSMLLMNTSNHAILRSFNALDAVATIFKRETGEKWPTHIVSKHWLRSHYCLIKSPYWQVRGYLAYLLARLCGKHGESVNLIHDETEFILSREAIPLIRILALDPKEKISSFAKEALEHFKDLDILEIIEIDLWVNSLDLPGSELLIKTLKNENISMNFLLSRVIKMEDVKKALSHVKDLKAGSYLRMVTSIHEIKERVEADYVDAEELARAAISLTGPLEDPRPNDRREDISLGTPNPKSPNEALKEEKPDVFISYSWGNKQSAQRLRKVLENQGLTVWMDEVKIKAGEQLFHEIDDGVSNSQIFLACLSPDYSRSVNCKRELLLATERKKIIIPLQVESLEEWPPRGDLGPLLAGKVYINLSSEDKLDELQEQLISAIKQSLK